MSETSDNDRSAPEAALSPSPGASEAPSAELRSDEFGFVDPASTDQFESIATYKEVSVEQLAAVRALLGDERRSTEFDILINTALEALRDGAMPERELVPSVEKVWPGTGINSARVANAMGAARQAGYVAPTLVRGESGWALTKEGAADVAGSRQWAQDTFETTARDVQEHLEAAGRDLDTNQAWLWTTT